MGSRGASGSSSPNQDPAVAWAGQCCAGTLRPGPVQSGWGMGGGKEAPVAADQAGSLSCQRGALRRGACQRASGLEVKAAGGARPGGPGEGGPERSAPGCSVGHQGAPWCWAQSRGGKTPKAPVPKVPGSTAVGPAGHPGLPQLPTAPAPHPDLGAGAREHQGLCSAPLPVPWVGPHGRPPAAPQPPALGPQPGWQAQHGPAGSGRPHSPTARLSHGRACASQRLARLACVSPRGGPGGGDLSHPPLPRRFLRPPSPLPHQRHTQEMRGSQARSRVGSSAEAAILIYVCGFV